MQARFRIRTVEGEELTPMTLEIFSELVRSGVVRPDDLVFDALTGEWAPAATHPMVLLVNDPLVTHPGSEEYWERRVGDLAEGESAEAEMAPGAEPVESPPAVTGEAEAQAAEAVAEAPPAEPASSEADAGVSEDGLSLDLVAEPETDPEEEARAFISQLQEEREAEADPDQLGYETQGIDVRSGIVEGVVPAPPVAPPVGKGDEFGPAVVPKGPPPRRKTTTRWQDRRQRWLLAVLLPAAIVVGTILIANPNVSLPGFLGGGGQNPAPDGSRATREVGDSEERLREVAVTALLDWAEGLRTELGVGAVPRDWLEGYYLADPNGYPDVRPYWERFLDHADAVRAEESDVYLAAYVAALEEAGVTGPVRSARIVTAREAWQAREPAREAHYARVMELGTAAMALHDMIVEVQGRITYEPARGERLSADPIIEAAGSDPEAQAQLEVALDRVLAAVQAAGTHADKSLLPGWLVSGLRAAVTGRATDPTPDTAAADTVVAPDTAAQDTMAAPDTITTPDTSAVLAPPVDSIPVPDTVVVPDTVPVPDTIAGTTTAPDSTVPDTIGPDTTLRLPAGN